MTGNEDLINRGLRMLAESSSTEAPVVVETRLLEAFRIQQRARRLRRGIAAVIIALGSAACFLMTLRLPRPVELPRPALVPSQHQPPPAASASIAAKIGNKRPPAHPGSVARMPVHKPSHKPAYDRLATVPFIPLPYGDPSLINDAATVVRVELRGSALREAGFLVAQDHVGDRVQADLLVGADGLPHAVRFVGFQQ
jgi:hypothetical protein